ncbi:unnamed protein product [Callosobruchus maculatus]|uniref:Anaphase-promoting complex subunit 4 WD40 domain-containing protein n=1 Tax=Callosobruchus maculatus TaxID=64391 RepID=A0A653CP46_CALMS|nr:unnamed protein product [Callosobruchus maculatus]
MMYKINLIFVSVILKIQANDANTVSIGTQTETFGELPDVKYLLKNTFYSPPEDIDEAVDRMFQIDKMVADLNEYRQGIFSEFISRTNSGPKVRKREHLERFVSYSKKARQDSEVSEPLDAGAFAKEEPDGKDSHKAVYEKRNNNFELHEKVLSTTVDGTRLVAATESGKVYIFDLTTMTEVKCITVSETPVVAVTCVRDENTSEILAASYDNAVRTYDARKMKLTRMLNTETIVQCMDEKWEYVFMGTSNGYLMRYSLKKNDIEFEEKFNEDCILTLKAISEGARKVLLVGAKEAPVCFRDAITGLHLRTLEHSSPTCSVFSIIVDVDIYCATDNHVQAFSFHEGTVKQTLKAESNKQISCIRLYRKLLFASCENGNIYIYATTQNSKVGCIEGPGGSILSMEVAEDKIFVGTSLLFKVIPIPESILNLKCCSDPIF